LVLLQEIAGLPEAQLRERLAALQEAEFLYETNLFPDTEYTFKHALTHDVAYNGILQERRKMLHVRILESMGELYADRIVEQLEQLAHHALRGEVWDKALSYLRQAGEKALSRSANRTAIATFEQALAAARRLQETREVVEQTIHVHLSSRLALTTMSELARSLQHSQEAARLAEIIDDQRRLAWALAAMTVSCAGVGDLAKGTLCAERSVVIASSLDDPIARIAAEHYLGWVSGHSGQFHKAIGLLTRCAAQLRPWLDAEGEVRGAASWPGFSGAGFFYVNALAWATMSHAELGQFGSAIERGQEAVRAGENMGLTYVFGMAKHRLGYAYLLRGDIEQGLPLLEQCGELAQRSDLPVLVTHLGACLGQAYCLIGRAEEAVVFIEKAHAVEEAGGPMLFVSVNLATLAVAYSLLGRSSEARKSAERALDCARRFGQRGTEAWALLTLGDVLAVCEQGAYSRAADAYAAALTLGTELQMRPLIARCHLSARAFIAA